MTENTEIPPSAIETSALQEIQHIPIWVKGILVTGIVLFAVQLPSFKSSLNDAVLKHRASAADAAGQYPKAIEIFNDLHSRYPNVHELTEMLGFAQYHAKYYVDALNTFNQLAGIKMPAQEVMKINAAISDMSAKLKLNTK